MRIEFDTVKKTYNGRTGCACGCRGRYSLPSVDVMEEANEDRGYPYEMSDVRPKSCKMAVNKMNKLIEQLGITEMMDEAISVPEEGIEWFRVWSNPFDQSGEKIAAVDIDGRATTVYFK